MVAKGPPSWNFEIFSHPAGDGGLLDSHEGCAGEGRGHGYCWVVTNRRKTVARESGVCERLVGVGEE